MDSQVSYRTVTSDSPPPYYLCRRFPAKNAWSNYKGLGRHHRKKGPEARVDMFYRSNPGAPQSDCTWAVRVTFQTKDLPRLMQRGVSLSQENVNFRKNHCRVLGERESQPWTHARYFEARDLSSFGPLWTAKVTVFAYEFGPLGSFRFGDLTLDTIHAATARDKSNRQLYKYSVLSPENNFNAIFDDLPLPGMWPWPKAPEEEPQHANGGGREKKRWSLRGALGIKKGV